MRRIPFTKMEGAGNDFVVIDATQHALRLSAAQRARRAHRGRRHHSPSQADSAT